MIKHSQHVRFASAACEETSAARMSFNILRDAESFVLSAALTC